MNTELQDADSASSPTPIHIEAEDYIRQSGGITTETCTDTGGGINLTNISNTTWAEYSVTVPTAGTYLLKFRVAGSGGSFQFKDSSLNVLTTVTIPNTGGGQTWTTVTATVVLPAGSQKLHFYTTWYGWNLNWIELVLRGANGSGSSSGVGGYRYGFNGKENDNEMEGEGNLLDFGARIYSSRLGRWLSFDPLQKKYPNIQPYHFCLNSPIHFIDPNGKEVIIKDQTGNKVAIVKADGKIVAEKGYENSSYIHYYQQAQTYLKDKGTLSFLEKHKETTVVQIVFDEGKGGSYDPGVLDLSKSTYQDINKNGSFDLSTEISTVKGVKFKGDGVIVWNPLKAVDDGEGNTHSPSLVLEHEVKHAKHRLIDPNKYHVDINTTTSDGSENMEEKNTILETNTSSANLNNGDGGTRTKHDRGSFYPTNSPTSRTKLTPIKIPDVNKAQRDNLGGSQGAYPPSKKRTL